MDKCYRVVRSCNQDKYRLQQRDETRWGLVTMYSEKEAELLAKLIVEEKNKGEVRILKSQINSKLTTVAVLHVAVVNNRQKIDELNVELDILTSALCKLEDNRNG